jgi:hypothetical protein
MTVLSGKERKGGGLEATGHVMVNAASNMAFSCLLAPSLTPLFLLSMLSGPQTQSRQCDGNLGVAGQQHLPLGEEGGSHFHLSL